MLRIRAAQTTALQSEAEESFLEDLRKTLAEKYPHCLPRFTRSAQSAIVANMLARAKAWGVTWKSALSAFAELMLAVAPNFDDEARIQAALFGRRDDIDQVVLTLERRVGEDAWAAAEARSHDLPLFVFAGRAVLSLEDLTARAFPLALGDLPRESEPRRWAKEAVETARRLGFGSVPDGALTYAACRYHFGEDFNNTLRHRWFADVIEPGRDARERVALMKLRIALECGRFV